MPTVPSHLKFTFRGHFEGAPEFWSFGCHFKRLEPLHSDIGLDDISESGVTTAIATFMGATSMGTVTRLDDWRAYVIGTNGRMEGDAPLMHIVDPGSPIAGTGGQNFPAQVACVVSKVGAHRGPGQFGRMYLPCLGLNLSTGGRLTAAVALSVAQATSAFLKGISDAIDAPGWTNSAEGCNVSVLPTGSGTLQTIDHVRVGRVLDTMTSRRTSLDEDYQEDSAIDW